MAERRAVVTGATGFVGPWAVRAAHAAGYAVEGWSRRAPAVELGGLSAHVALDVSDARAVGRAMSAARPAWVLHLAGESSALRAAQDPGAAERANVQGTGVVCAAAAAVGARVVVVSSCQVYGRPRQLPMPESHPLAPEDVYGRTKRDAEAAARASGAQVVVARAFHHTGPGQQPPFALADWAAQLAQGHGGDASRPVVTGALDLRRDFLDVRDVVDAYILLAQRAAAGSTVNVCSGKAVALGALLDLLAAAPGVHTRTAPERLRPGAAPEVCGDPTALRALGWTARVPLAQSMRELAATARKTAAAGLERSGG